jgi:protease-4
MLRLLLALVVNLLRLPFLPLLLVRRRFAARRGAWLELELDGSLSEMAHRGPPWQRSARALDLHGIRRALDLASADPRVSGVLVTLRELRARSATATALRDLFQRFRERGKRVVVHLVYGADTVDFYVASVADRILISPEAVLTPSGFAVQTPYFGDVLRRAGVDARVFAEGRYKTAGEPLVRTEMSAAQREQVGAFLDVAWDVVIEAVATGRRVSRETVEGWVNRGLWSAREAVEAGLCDQLAYEDERPKLLGSGSSSAPILALRRYVRRRRLRSWPLRRPRRVAVIELSGTIVSRGAGPMAMAVERDVRRVLAAVRDDRRYAGAVLFVDSRGGSAIASDHILREVRRLAETKPVAACFGDVAASGGYMAGVGTSHIVAQPTTLTGSIGVVAAHFQLSPLLDRLGIRVESVKRGEHADAFGPARRLSDEESRLYEAHLSVAYRSFLEAVARGRNQPVDVIEPLAGGRVYAGRDALARGLIDELGGLETAIGWVNARLGRELEPELVESRRGIGRWLNPGAVASLDFPLLALRESVWAICPAWEVDLGER